MQTENSTVQTHHVIKVSKLQKYLFQHYKVWERKLVSYVFEKDDLKLHRKGLSHYGEEEAAVEFASKVEEYYLHLFYQAIETVVNCNRNRFQEKKDRHLRHSSDLNYLVILVNSSSKI